MPTAGPNIMTAEQAREMSVANSTVEAYLSSLQQNIKDAATRGNRYCSYHCKEMYRDGVVSEVVADLRRLGYHVREVDDNEYGQSYNYLTISW